MRPRMRVSDQPRPLELLAFSALWVPYLWLVARFWYVTDDAYISFRYAKNWVSGYGLRFNLGDATPVEGYSNFLWVIVCGVIEWLGWSIERWPLLISATCGSLLMGLLFHTLRARLQLSLPIATIAMLFFALHPPIALHSTSGLATMPFALALFVAFDQLILRKQGIGAIGGGLAVLALALLRVEGAGWALLLFALSAISHRMRGEQFWRSLGIAAAIFVVGYGSYFAWRFHYYGLPFPNTVYAKSAFGIEYFSRGVRYVVQHGLTQLTPLLIIAATPFALRKERRATGLPIAALAIGFYVYAMLVGGDFMAMGRFLVPGWPFAVLMIAWMLRDLASVSARYRAMVLAAAVGVAVVGVLPAFDLYLLPREARMRFHFRWNQEVDQFRSEYQIWAAQKQNAAMLAVRGRAMRCWLPPDTRFVIGGIGATGYFSELYVYDRNGLVDHEVAMAAAEGPLKSPGHDKLVDVSFFLSRDPHVLRATLTGGQKLAGREAAPREAQQAFFRYLMKWRQDLIRGFADRDRYVVDFRPVPAWEPGDVDQQLVLIRRIPDGVRPEDAWAEFMRRAQRYRLHGDAGPMPPISDRCRDPSA